MGSSSSKTESSTAISDFISVINSNTQQCYSSTNQSNIIAIEGVTTAGSINVSNNKSSNVATASVTCLQNAPSTTDLTTNITTEATQVSSSIQQALSLGSASSTDINNYTLALGQAVTNAYLQKCTSTSAQSNNITIANDTATGDVVVVGNTQSNVIQSLTTCTENDATVTAAATDLQDYLNQNSSAQSQNILGSLGSLFSGLFSGVKGIIIGIAIFIFIILIVGGLIFLIMHLMHKKKLSTTSASPAQQAALLAALSSAATPSASTAQYGVRTV